MAWWEQAEAFWFSYSYPTGSNLGHSFKAPHGLEEKLSSRVIILHILTQKEEQLPTLCRKKVDGRRPKRCKLPLGSAAREMK